MFESPAQKAEICRQELAAIENDIIYIKSLLNALYNVTRHKLFAKEIPAHWIGEAIVAYAEARSRVDVRFKQLLNTTERALEELITKANDAGQRMLTYQAAWDVTLVWHNISYHTVSTSVPAPSQGLVPAARDNSISINFNEWLDLISDIGVSTWETYRDKYIEADRTFQASVQRTKTLAKHLSGFSLFPYTIRKNQIKNLFEDIRTLYDYVKGFPDAVREDIDKHYRKDVNAAAHDLSLIQKKSFKTDNTLGIIDFDPERKQGCHTPTSPQQKDHLTFDDFTGGDPDAYDLVDGMEGMYGSSGYTIQVNNQAANGFVKLFKEDFIATRSEIVEMETANVSGALQFIRDNPGVAIVGATTDPATGETVPELVYDPELSKKQLDYYEEMLSHLQQEQSDLEDNIIDPVIYKTYMDQYLVLGEFDHNLDRPVRKFFSTVLDCIPSIAVLEGIIGYDFIAGTPLTQEQAKNKIVWGVVDAVILVTTLGTGTVIKTGATATSKTVYKAVVKDAAVYLISDSAGRGTMMLLDEAGAPTWAQFVAALTVGMGSAAGMNKVMQIASSQRFSYSGKMFAPSSQTPQTPSLQMSPARKVSVPEKLQAKVNSATELAEDSKAYANYLKNYLSEPVPVMATPEGYLIRGAKEPMMSFEEFRYARQMERMAVGPNGGEVLLKDTYGGRSQVPYETTLGSRTIDQLSNGIAHESKVGYKALDAETKAQILKDVELIKTKQIKGSIWHFYISDITGQGGGSKQLLEFLDKNGIKYEIHTIKVSPGESFSGGKLGEDLLKVTYGGESQVPFETTQGTRIVDQLADGIAYESKVGYKTLDVEIKSQILKDAELIKTGQIRESIWHFYKSDVTGDRGASKQLLDFLNQNGIKYVMHS